MFLGQLNAFVSGHYMGLVHYDESNQLVTTQNIIVHLVPCTQVIHQRDPLDGHTPNVSQRAYKMELNEQLPLPPQGQAIAPSYVAPVLATPTPVPSRTAPVETAPSPT